jgi:hypothetical protein
MAKDSFRHYLTVSGYYQHYRLGNRPGGPGYSGWQYIGMAAAHLGLAEECAEIMTNNCAYATLARVFRPCGGRYDAVPDVDHGANILTAL